MKLSPSQKIHSSTAALRADFFSDLGGEISLSVTADEEGVFSVDRVSVTVEEQPIDRDEGPFLDMQWDKCYYTFYPSPFVQQDQVEGPLF